MQTPVYHFDRFLLDPRARELLENGERVVLPLSTVDCLIHLVRHRDRPVGRDELAAVVWERADVSEVSVSHAIMRLRRLLGDTGTNQHAIRTVPRLGYRWVLEGTVEEWPEQETVADAAMPGEPLSTQPARAALPGRRQLHRAGFAALLAIVFVGLAVTAFSLRPRGSATQADTVSPPPVPAVVLPAEISAPAQWAWLKLGLMDLVANQLRHADLATAPSETVVAMLDRNPTMRPADALQSLKAELRIQPSVSLVRDIWTVRLEAHRAVENADESLIVEAHDADAIRATRTASDELLIKLGRAPPGADTSNAALIRETLRQRVSAAVLSGQLAVARKLIEDATPALQNQPEIALSQASVEFFSGNYENAVQTIQSLLYRIPGDRFPELRGRALSTLGATRFRQGRIADASVAYDEAVRLLQNGDEPISLAKALLGRGGVASQRMQLESAASDYSRARALYELGNDLFGSAVVDLNLGMIAIQREQPAVALSLLRGASEHLRQLGADDALAASLVSTVEVELLLLDVDSALATSAEFDSLQQRAGNQRQRWELMLSRARALAAAGRLGEADHLLAQILAQSSPDADSGVRLQANALMATTAFQRGDSGRAADLATAALAPELADRAPFDHASVRLVYIRALLQGGGTAQATTAVAALRSWSAAADHAAARFQATLAEGYLAFAAGQPVLARQHFSAAMGQAIRGGIPADLVAAGEPLVRVLVAAADLDAADATYRHLAPWADRDMRVAWSHGLIEAAREHGDAAASAFARARQLAGERSLPAGPVH
ncbi:MAG TPA: winged helix-turn-helix domain-containing protein [Dokdonella sp.]|nr:winged helix-turn-helix domain-containing protein [Dokdonella sp.]